MLQYFDLRLNVQMAPLQSSKVAAKVRVLECAIKLFRLYCCLGVKGYTIRIQLGMGTAYTGSMWCLNKCMG